MSLLLDSHHFTREENIIISNLMMTSDLEILDSLMEIDMGFICRLNTKTLSLVVLIETHTEDLEPKVPNKFLIINGSSNLIEMHF